MIPLSSYSSSVLREPRSIDIERFTYFDQVGLEREKNLFNVLFSAEWGIGVSLDWDAKIK